MLDCSIIACLFCILCIFIGLGSLIQFACGIYLSFIRNDLITINRLIKTEQFDSYLFYILLIFVGLGFISLVLCFISICSTVRRLKSLSLFVTILWIFSVALNIVMFIILILYYFVILPQLRPLLIRTLQQTPLATSDLLDTIQSDHNCCGISNKNDYNNLPLEPFPSSCCRVPNCWRDTDINNNSGLNNTVSLMYTDGCYPIIEKYVTIELWILLGITAFCGFLQFIAVILICTLYQRYKKLEDDPKFVINQFNADIPNHNLQNSSHMPEKTVEITQI